MTDFSIPCDTFVRLANVIHTLPDDIEPVFRCVRIDNGCAIATDRNFMAIEKITDVPGIVHVIPSLALINQCRVEAGFNGTLTITVNDMLKYAVAKTSLGYVHPENVGQWFEGPNLLDRWHEIVMQANEPAQRSIGGMYWDCDGIAKLANSSPSGRVVFEEKIDATRPSLIRDTSDYSWLGVFNPFTSTQSYQPASMPSWVSAR